MPKTPASFRFAVEAGKIRELADAIADPRPLLRDRSAARAAGLPAIPAPVAFTRSAYFQDTTNSSIYGQLGIQASEMRHAQQEWRIEEPLYAGRIYRTSAWKLVREETKTSRRGGTLRFVTAERSYRAGRRVVLTEWMTSVVVSGAGPSPAPAEAPAHRAQAEPFTRTIRQRAEDWRRAAPGEVLVDARIGPLGLSDFVRFAGAIGDFTPIHHDRDQARRFGLPDIIAMGTLPAAQALSLVEDGYGAAGIAGVKLRFHEPLYEGRSLDIRLTAADGGAVLDVRDSTGAPIISGTVQPRA